MSRIHMSRKYYTWLKTTHWEINCLIIPNIVSLGFSFGSNTFYKGRPQNLFLSIDILIVTIEIEHSRM